MNNKNMNILSKKFKSLTFGRPGTISVVDGDINYALKLLKSDTKDKLKEYYEHIEYKKPSKVKREKKIFAKYKQKSEQT